MSRHRTTSDEAVIMATIRVITRVGPTRMTLADVAKECGLAPATLVQRYGSKRGLLLTVAKAGSAGMEECFGAMRASHASPLAALIATFTEMQLGNTPEELANSLAFLQMDLTDPDFHRLAETGARGSLAGTRSLLEAAVEAGELLPCDTAAVARLLHAATSGSMLAWAILREGTVSDWVRKDLETLLAPYRTAPPAHG